MRRWLRTLTAGLLACAAPVAAAPKDHSLKLPDGRTLNLWCDGRRGPVVILDAGWAADSRAWRRVMSGLSSSFRVCAQDRAGSGLSDPGPLPRDGEAVAGDLKAALTAGSVPGPYILVGHSLGGLNMRHFARLFPADTAALVLVDPSLPGQGVGAESPLIVRSRKCLAAARAGPIPEADPELSRCRTSQPERAAARWEARLSELESLPLTTSTGLAGQGAGSMSMPLIVLTAGVAPEPGGNVSAKAEAHRQVARISSRGIAELVPDSGHMMLFDRPDAIVAAVEAVQRAVKVPASSGVPES